MQLVGVRLTAIANIGTHLLYRDGFAIGDLSSLLTCLWDLCSLGNEFVCGVICNEVHDRTAICAALVISDFFIGRQQGRCWEGDLCGIKFGGHVSQVHLGERESSLTAHGSADLLASGLAGVQDGNCVVDFRMWPGNNMSRDNFTDAATGRGA